MKRLFSAQTRQIKRLGIKPRDVQRIGMHEPRIKCCSRGLADLRLHLGVARIRHADVQDRAGAAPIWVLAGGAHRQQWGGVKGRKNAIHIGQLPLGDLEHRIK